MLRKKNAAAKLSRRITVEFDVAGRFGNMRQRLGSFGDGITGANACECVNGMLTIELLSLKFGFKGMR